MYLHDTHFHLDLCQNPENMVSSIEKAKVYTIAVTNTPSVFFYTKRITQNTKYLRPALGFHPELAAQRRNEITQFEQLISETRYIGEIGLDNRNKKVDDYSIQKEIFQKILSICADKKDKILTVHSRRASADVISMIGNNFPGKVIMHWYSGSTKDLDIALRYGFFFSINYPMTTSESGKKIIERLPSERILLESDGPFTTLGSQAFDPTMCNEIYDRVSKSNSLLSHQILHDNFMNILK